MTLTETRANLKEQSRLLEETELFKKKPIHKRIQKHFDPHDTSWAMAEVLMFAAGFTSLGIAMASAFK
jgi:hypothetical protein